jgi:diaminohydroxyphosphoribosylaminopyrimidine deaminase/5-amino-6-(5-phosphoribosylamino)uracil reductase
MTSARPYIHAKWAMTLDGKIASRSRHSQWISNEASRRKVHELRGRMDAIIVGAMTARLDDPLLTARPAGPRVATRIVIDADLSLSTKSQLMETAREYPLLIATTQEAIDEHGKLYTAMGAELLPLAKQDERLGHLDLDLLLQELGRREMTNVLVEGGGSLLGGFFDRKLIDHLHVFLAPKLIGGSQAVSPIGGHGLEQVPNVDQFVTHAAEFLDGDVYWHGMLETAWWKAFRTPETRT